MIFFQLALSSAFFRVAKIPRLRGERFFSTVETHIERGLPFGRFQSRGILAQSAHDVLHSRSSFATRPNRLRRRLAIVELRGPYEVWHQIWAFVTWSVQQTWHNLLRHHWSKRRACCYRLVSLSGSQV